MNFNKAFVLKVIKFKVQYTKLKYKQILMLP